MSTNQNAFAVLSDGRRTSATSSDISWHSSGEGRSDVQTRGSLHTSPRRQTNLYTGSRPASSDLSSIFSPSRLITIVDVTLDREMCGGTLTNAPFLSRWPAILEPAVVHREIKPFLSTCVFKIHSTLDLNFLVDVLNLPPLRGSIYALNKVEFSSFYWFSGISSNRLVNPFLTFATQLPNLRSLALTFHTAGFTESAWKERERINIEKDNFERSKLLRLKRLDQIIDFYDLRKIHSCQNLRVMHMNCIDSEMVRKYAHNADPLSPYRDLVNWLRHQLPYTLGRNVTIVVRIDGQISTST